jgi:hypothetical protein
MVPTITAGSHAVLYVSEAEATLTNEPMTNLDPSTHLVYQITDPTKRVISPTYAVTPKAGYSGTFTVNRLTGTLTFSTSNLSSETMNVSGKYVPMTALAYAHDFSISLKPKAVDATAFNVAMPYLSKSHVISGMSGTIGSFFDPTNTTGTPEYFLTKQSADTAFALKFYVSANYSLLAWVRVDTEALKFAIENLVDETVSFSGVPDADNRVLSQS